MPIKRFWLIYLFILTTFLYTASAFSWNDETHLAIAKAAGYKSWYNAAGPDITKVKADKIEAYNHYFDNKKNLEINETMVIDQAKLYNNPSDGEGHLYGAIIGSIREYEKAQDAGKYGEYHIAFCAHYVGDLSQPLHNSQYDAFNRKRHLDNDKTVEAEVLSNISKITENMHPVVLNDVTFEKDLAKEIARIANLARELDKKIRKEHRNMTKEEAYKQLGLSASLFKMILKHFKKVD